MRQLFDREIIERAVAPPEEIEKAKKHGRFFQYSDPSEGVLITGYWWNDVSYITDISHNHGGEMDECGFFTYELARKAYEAYCDSTGWKSAVTGADLPPFDNCPVVVKKGWIAVAKKMALEVGA